jgi:methionyl-tRNA formyltransferase
MRIALLCATRRGLSLLHKLRELRPEDELFVASFRETEHEPPFLEDIRRGARECGAAFMESGARFPVTAWQGLLGGEAPDLLLVVSWRYLLPEAVTGPPLRGTWIFHDSLLPRFRGFAPTVWAILRGASETGVTLFRATPEVDAGDIVAQRPVPIGRHDVIAEVMERVTGACEELLAENLEALCAGTARLRPQAHELATYTCRRLPADNEIEWQGPTRAIYDLIRAVGRPYPGAFTHLDGRRLRIWEARLEEDQRTFEGFVPGRVVEVRPGEGTVVVGSDGLELLLRQVQLDGEEACCAADVLDRLSMTLG